MLPLKDLRDRGLQSTVVPQLGQDCKYKASMSLLDTPLSQFPYHPSGVTHGGNEQTPVHSFVQRQGWGSLSCLMRSLSYGPSFLVVSVPVYVGGGGGGGGGVCVYACVCMYQN